MDKIPKQKLCDTVDIKLDKESKADVPNIDYYDTFLGLSKSMYGDGK